MTTKKASGFCVECSDIATSEALYKLSGIVVVRKYCDKCIDTAKYEIENE